MENVNKPTFQEINAWINSLEVKNHPYRKPVPGFPYMVVSVRSEQKGEFNGKNSEELFMLVKQNENDFIKKQTKDYGFPDKGLPFDEPSSEESKESSQGEMDIREIEILKTPKIWIEKFLSFFVKGEKNKETKQQSI